ncbi:MAG: hypothetical protein ACK565_13070 [Pirellulaceae bacterium]|jgi:hypothetical protein
MRMPHAGLACVLMLLTGLTFFNLTSGSVLTWSGASLRGVAAVGAVQHLEATSGPQLRQLNQLVHLWVEHSEGLRVGPEINWVQWLLGTLYPPAARSQLAARILASGEGDCSERSAVLQAILSRRGIASRLVGLGGHVVLETQPVDGGGLVLDPDYGVEFPGTVSELSGGQRDDEIRSALASAGFAESQIQLYREILYSQQDNQAIDWNRPLSPRLFWMEWMTQGVVQVACCGVILFLIGTIRW